MPPNAYFFTESSENLSRVAKEFVGRVALVVTSPPYHNAISYSAHQSDETSDYRIRETRNYSGEYLELLSTVWHECWKMLRPGGHLAINVGTVLVDGLHFPLSLDVQNQLKRSGEWVFVRNIHWHKVTAGVRRAGTVIQHRLPGYWYPNIMSEHIIVVRKETKKKDKRVSDKEIPAEWWESIWDLAPVPPNTIKHPAPFPEDLPHRLIRMLTSPQEYVLDPFNGSGTTTKAAYDLDRHGIGFDTSLKYRKLAEQRLKEPSKVRSSQLRVLPTKPSEFVPKVRKEAARQGTGQTSRRRLKGE